MRTNTRNEILSAALNLFTSQGYERTSLREIAEQLGITKAALYYHFPAKDLIVAELATPWLAGLSDLVDSQGGDDGADPQEVLASYVDVCIRHHAVLRFLSRDAAALESPELGRRARQLLAALAQTLCGPHADEVRRIRVACAVEAVHGVVALDPDVLPMARDVVVEAASAALGATIRASATN